MSTNDIPDHLRHPARNDNGYGSIGANGSSKYSNPHGTRNPFYWGSDDEGSSSSSGRLFSQQSSNNQSFFFEDRGRGEGECKERGGRCSGGDSSDDGCSQALSGTGLISAVTAHSIYSVLSFLQTDSLFGINSIAIALGASGVIGSYLVYRFDNGAKGFLGNSSPEYFDYTAGKITTKKATINSVVGGFGFGFASGIAGYLVLPHVLPIAVEVGRLIILAAQTAVGVAQVFVFSGVVSTARASDMMINSDQSKQRGIPQRDAPSLHRALLDVAPC
ncbi:MAG: hypothetical protein WC521_09185 [Bdellovibrionales bacterium]